MLRKLAGFYNVTDDLRSDVMELKRERINLDPGATLIAAGDLFTHLYLVEDGWIMRVRHMPGGTRQIVNIALAGDFLCFGSLMFERSDFDIICQN